MSKNIIYAVHEKMNEFYDQYETRPAFIYLGDSEYQRLLMSQNIFCPPEYQAHVSLTELFKMQIVLTKRHSFLEVG